MNFTNIILWSFTVVSMWAVGKHVDDIHAAILKAQVRLIYESRTETWGSPRLDDPILGREGTRGLATGYF